MLVGGLAGVSPHMIAATVMAVSRCLYEFHDQLGPQLPDQLVETCLVCFQLQCMQTKCVESVLANILFRPFLSLQVLLQSPSREILRSTLSFFSVALSIMDKDAFHKHVGPLVQGMMG